MLQYAFYMYWGEMECVGQSFAYKVGLHPSALARLSSITSNLKSRYLNGHGPSQLTQASLVFASDTNSLSNCLFYNCTSLTSYINNRSFSLK
jgi:hypothetical protein